ncbi:hypothetical protein [Pararhodobacter sp.]|uniref:hypothetical protein n=1 Tax=Pararhodobacter sp. TaxID=2127056 RepID=UPI002FDD82F6
MNAALRALNDAAYAAEKAARKAKHPAAADLLRLAWRTDEILDANMEPVKCPT